MNRADVALLNQSIEGLGNTFFQNRAMAQRANEAEMERQLRQSMLEEQIQGRKDIANEQRLSREDATSARRDYYADMGKHWDKMETEAKLHNSLLETQNTSKSISDGMSRLADMVRNGAVSSDDADAYFKSAIDGVAPEMKERMLSDPSMRAAYEGNLDWSKVQQPPTPKDIKPQPFTVPGPDGTPLGGTYNPNTGSFQFFPVDKEMNKSVTTKDQRTGQETRLTGTASQVDQAMRNGAGNPAPAAVGPGATPGAAPATLKFIRDKTGKLVPQMPQAFQPPIQPPAGVDPSYGNLGNGLQIPSMH